MTFTLRIDGNPVAKGRPRVTNIGGFARAYTPTKTKKYEELVAYAAREAWGSGPPMDGPLRLTLVVRLPIPASWSKRKKAEALAGEIRPTSKPDIDNFCKIISDALNEICYHDDAQIVEALVRKTYSELPGVDVNLTTPTPGAITCTFRPGVAA